MSICMISPKLPPAFDGVGDYSHRLWKHWPEPAPSWRFLVMAGAAASQAQWPEVGIEDFAGDERSLRASLERSGVRTVILQYVGYGYDRQGAPLWMAPALQGWKSAQRGRRVIVMFHELFADGPIWRRAFWTKGAQQRVVKELIAVADRWITSCPRYWTQLQTLFQAEKSKGSLIPIASNIVPDALPASRPAWPLSRNQKLRIVVFGLPHTRVWALEAHRDFLRGLIRHDLVSHITLMGKGRENARISKKTEKLKKQIAPDTVWREAFDLSGEQISTCLQAHDLGVLSNAPDLLTKSGVFAALCAHGVLPVVKAQGEPELETDIRQALLMYRADTAGMQDAIAHLRDAGRVDQTRCAAQALAQTRLSWHGAAQAYARTVMEVEGRRPGGNVHFFPPRQRETSRQAELYR